jgi:hypothetical protein
VLACQEQIIDKLRTDPARLVLVRFDAAEISPTTIRGTAVNVFDNDRRLSYRCTGAEATVSFLQAQASRTTASETDFPVEEVKACHAAIMALIKRDQRNADPSFETAGMMPTDSAMAIRGVGVDRSSGQPQSLRYQCHWDGDRIVGASYRFGVR